MVTRLESSRKFKDKVLNSFNRSKKTIWSGSQVQNKIKELWAKFLEEELSKRKERK